MKMFTMMSNVDDFFKKLKVGDIFVYTDCYTFEEVKRMAERRSKKIESFDKESEESKKYDSCVAEVTEDISKKSKVFHYANA